MEFLVFPREVVWEMLVTEKNWRCYSCYLTDLLADTNYLHSWSAWRFWRVRALRVSCSRPGSDVRMAETSNESHRQAFPTRCLMAFKQHLGGRLMDLLPDPNLRICVKTLCSIRHVNVSSF